MEPLNGTDKSVPFPKPILHSSAACQAVPPIRIKNQLLPYRGRPQVLKHPLFAAQCLHRFDGGGASGGNKPGYCGCRR